MTYQELRAALQINNQQVTITGGALTPNISDLLRNCYANQPLILSAAEPGPGDDIDETVVITGKSSFLNIADLVVQARFSLDTQGEVQATLKYTLIGDLSRANDWKFSRSFPDLPTLFNFQDGGLRSPLDDLRLFNTYFVVTTYAHQESEFQIGLTSGINFVSKLTPSGILGILESTLGQTNPLILYGTIHLPKPTDVTLPLKPFQYPWDGSCTAPGIHLQAVLGVDIRLQQMVLNQTIFRMYSPLSTAWLTTNQTFTPLLAYTGLLTIPSAAISVQMTALMLPGSSDLEFIGNFQGVTVKNLANLLDIAGPSNLNTTLPAPIKSQIESLGDTLSDLALTYAAVELELDQSGMAILGTSFIIELPLHWAVWDDPQILVSKLDAYFAIDDPFHSPVFSVLLMGDCEIEGVPVKICAGDVGGFTVYAELGEAQTIPLKKLMATYAPDVPAPSDLTVDRLTVTLSPANYYAMSAALAQKPQPWVIEVGPKNLTISDVNLAFAKQKGGALSGSFGGTIAFADDVALVARYDIPGDIIIRGDFPQVKLSQLLDKICDQRLDLPSKFDIDFVNSSVLMQKQGANYCFQFGTQVEGVGSFAFQAQRAEAGWGFALGLDVSHGKASTIAGLEELQRFEEFFALQKLLLVVSSLDDPGFTFPDLAAFNNPVITSKKLQLPASVNGVQKGFNLYAQTRLDGNEQLKQLGQLLGVSPELVLDAALSVSVPPTQNSRFAIGIEGKINNMLFQGSCGAGLQGGDFYLFGRGMLTTTLNTKTNEKAQISGSLIVVPDGMFLSGTYQGPPVQFDVVQLTNLALEVGIDWEGIPSLGIAATIDIEKFDSSVAIFFNSADPQKSLFAGSVSDLSLQDVVATLVGVIPEASGEDVKKLEAVLAKVTIKGTSTFTIPGELSEALDKRDLTKVAPAFQTNGGVKIPTNINSVLLTVNQSGEMWSLTDKTTPNLRHYQLRKQGASIQVGLEAQIYCAPEDTQIGDLPLFRQGFFINGKLEFFDFVAAGQVDINPNLGIAIDTQMDPLVVFSDYLLRIAGYNGAGGPVLSLSTYTRTSLPLPPPKPEMEKEFKAPHFFLSGQIKLLEVIAQDVFVDISANGLAFDLKRDLIPGTAFDIHGHIGGPRDFGAGGSVSLGLDVNLDFGALGRLAINVKGGGSLDVGYDGNQAWARLNDAFFEFQSHHYNLGKLELQIGQKPLENLGKTMLVAIEKFFKNFFNDAQTWLIWVKANFITGVEDIEPVLKQVWGYTEETAHTLMQAAGFVVSVAEKTCATTRFVHLAASARAAGNAETDETLDFLRRVRTDLQQTAKGQAYLKIYNASNASIDYLLQHDEGVKQAVRQQHGITLLNHCLADLQTNNTESLRANQDIYANALIVVARAILAAANTGNYAQVHQDAVRKAFNTIRSDMPQYQGMNYAQIMEELRVQSAT
ncbi:MAG: hypothetical protein U0350_28815 [Caldilineaceae bacterium]